MSNSFSICMAMQQGMSIPLIQSSLNEPLMRRLVRIFVLKAILLNYSVNQKEKNKLVF